MRKIGYVRLGTGAQCVDRQIDALASVCDELHIEKLSAATLKRPVYRAVVDDLRATSSGQSSVVPRDEAVSASRLTHPE